MPRRSRDAPGRRGAQVRFDRTAARRAAYEDTTLPGYLFLADDRGGPRPTVVYHGGYDSTLEESHPALAAGALRRGYHVLAFDGPGQGTVIRDQGLPFRPDWEAVVTPVVDFALSLPETDADRLVLIGTSFGGYLAARAAAFEHRLAACVLHDGVHDVHEAFRKLSSGHVDSSPEGLARLDTQTRWAVLNGLWTFGVRSVEELAQACRPYVLDEVAHRIDCPTLVLEAQNDQFFQGQPQRVYDALTCTKELMVFPEDEGGGEHCHEGAVALWHQRAFDWLDGVLA